MTTEEIQEIYPNYDPALHEPIFNNSGKLIGYKAISTPMPEKPKLIVTSVKIADVEQDENESSFLAKVGDKTDVKIQIEDVDGNLIPITDSFALPLAGVFNTPPKVRNVSFVDGQADFSITWDCEGIWKVTNEQVNYSSDLFYFSGIEFRVEA